MTSDSGTELASNKLAAAATFKHTFSAVGTFAYHCTIHSYMTAKVVVLAAGAALPATDTGSSAAGAPGQHWDGLLVILLAGLAAVGLVIRRLRPIAEP